MDQAGGKFPESEDDDSSRPISTPTKRKLPEEVHPVDLRHYVSLWLPTILEWVSTLGRKRTLVHQAGEPTYIETELDHAPPFPRPETGGGAPSPVKCRIYPSCPATPDHVVQSDLMHLPHAPSSSFVALCPSIWSHQFGETGLFSAAKLTDLHPKP